MTTICIKLECEFSKWQDWNLASGYYNGADLTVYGFQYKRGDYIHITQRYRAMLDWKRAMRLMIMI